MNTPGYLAKVGPQMLAAKAKNMLLREVSKGCGGDICPMPVAVEPPYAPLALRDRMFDDSTAPVWVQEQPLISDEFLRPRVWISPEQNWDWNRNELLLKYFSSLDHRGGMEIVGNSEAIHMRFLCHRTDFPVVQTAFRGQFELCGIADQDSGFVFGGERQWANAEFLDFLPPPPYSHLMSLPSEVHMSTLTTVLSCLGALPPPALGLYQVVFQPVSPEHDWHHNVKTLQDLEYAVKLIGGISESQRYAQQAPSVALTHMATDLETKADRSKPFFAAALRMAIADGGENAWSHLRALASVAGAFQHGGRPLRTLCRRDYLNVVEAAAIGRMLCNGLTHRAGFLVNSAELTTMCHLVPPSAATHLREVFRPMETLPADPSLATGTRLGVCECAGQPRSVCIPEAIRGRHVYIVGGTGTGKSTLEERMILQDIRAGYGVAVIDPHGPLVQRVLRLVPPEYADKVVFLDPGDPTWIVRWNPLKCAGQASRSRVAEDLINAFKSFIDGWGDRLEHLLRHALFAVLHLPDGCLLDVANLLRQKSRRSAEIRSLLQTVLEDEYSSTFWKEDFVPNYRTNTDLTPPQHKLSKLLGPETVGAMLSQRESAFDFRKIMDTGQILLVDLSTVGAEVKNVLGCFILSLLHLTAQGRDAALSTPPPFHLYCDEAQRFVTDSLEDMLIEGRKYGLSATLATQNRDQLGARKTKALGGVGSTIMFRVDSDDAQHLRKDLQGKVSVDDMVALGVGWAIARIDNHVVRVHTDEPLEIPSVNCRDHIIQRSRELYCIRFSELRKRARPNCHDYPGDEGNADGSGAAHSGTKPRGEDTGGAEDFSYDTF